MTPDRYRKIRTLFDQICRLPPEERAHALDEACAGDPGLRAETERLLGHDEQPAAFLSMPLFEGGPAHNEDDQDDDQEPLPEMIADCRVLRVIGRGGMGTVYLAKQQQPRREVAIKVMRAGFSSTAARRRFEFEAELLANLIHPGIAQVYRADTYVAADRRVPYFVMEYIHKARTILAHAKAQDLDLYARLELFAKVCDAVQFAHQKGVIHRDLKPANILVDSSGRPRVIDFGVARVFETDGGIPRTPPTEDGQQFGTPEYMSPEQCAGGSRDVDVRSDVYSLGVVLYELLTGVMPYDLSSVPRHRIPNVIAETDPRRPASIERSLRGDPETIVLKALEKNRDRRYQSAAELAADVRHYLNGAPIEARRANRLYVIRKQCRRHWPTVTSLCTVVLLLVLSLIVSTVQRRQTETQRTKAELARQAADLATHKAKILLSRMWVQLDHPVNAEKLLRAEGDRQNDEGLRFAVREFEGRYPKLFPLVTLGRLQDVGFSPSGDWLAAVGADGSLRLLDARDGSVTQTLSARTVRARCVAFGTLTSSLFIGGSDGLLRILPFSEQTGRTTESPPRELDTSLASITCLAMTRDGRRLAAAGTQVAEDTGELGGAVFVWDVRAGRRLFQLKIPKPVNDVAFSRDGGKLAAACDDGIVRIWRVSDATLLNMSREFEPALRAIEFDRGGDRLLVGAKYLSWWDPVGDKYERLERDARWGIRSIDVSPDGRYLAAAAGDGLVRYYHTEQHRLLYTRGYHDNAVAGHINVVFAPSGARVASVGSDGLRVWRFLPAEAAELVDDDGRSYSAVHAEFSSVDGSVLITARANRGTSAHRLFRWDQHSRPRAILRGSYTELSAPVPMRDGRVFLAGRRFDGSCVGLFVENLPGHEAEPVAVELMDLPRPSAVLVLEGNEPTVLLGFADGSIRQWSPSRGQPDLIHKFGSACTRIVADKDRRWLIATSEGDGIAQNGRVVWWRIHRSASTGTIELQSKNEFGTEHRVWDATVIGNATETPLVATAGNTKNVSVWDAASGKRITSLVGHSDAIRQCIALDDRLVVTSSDDRTVRIWNAANGEELCKVYAGQEGAPVLAAQQGRIVIADGSNVLIVEVPLSP